MLFVYLCAKGANRSWERISWIVELAAFTRDRNLDWSRVWNIAIEYGAERMVTLGTLVAHLLLGSQLPQLVQDEVDANPNLRRSAQDICRALREQQALEISTVCVSKWPYFLSLKSSLSQKIGMLVWLLFTPTEDDWLILKVNRHLYPLLYIVKLIRLVLNTVLRGKRLSGGLNTIRPVPMS